MDGEGNGAWFEVRRRGTLEQRRKELRKSLFTAVVEWLRQVRRVRPTVGVGVGHGAVVVALSHSPLTREAAFRERHVRPDEADGLGAAAARIAQLFLLRPAVLLRAGGMQMVLE